MTREHLVEWRDPTANRAIFGVEGCDSPKPRSIGSLTQAEIDEGIRLAKMRRAADGNHAEYRAVADMLRRARRQIQGGRR